jgi:hypothetical protein
MTSAGVLSQSVRKARMVCIETLCGTAPRRVQCTRLAKSWSCYMQLCEAMLIVHFALGAADSILTLMATRHSTGTETSSTRSR